MKMKTKKKNKKRKRRRRGRTRRRREESKDDADDDNDKKDDDGQHEIHRDTYSIRASDSTTVCVSNDTWKRNKNMLIIWIPGCHLIGGLTGQFYCHLRDHNIMIKIVWKRIYKFYYHHFALENKGLILH